MGKVTDFIRIKRFLSHEKIGDLYSTADVMIKNNLQVIKRLLEEDSRNILLIDRRQRLQLLKDRVLFDRIIIEHPDLYLSLVSESSLTEEEQKQYINSSHIYNTFAKHHLMQYIQEDILRLTPEIVSKLTDDDKERIFNNQKFNYVLSWLSKEEQVKYVLSHNL